MTPLKNRFKNTNLHCLINILDVDLVPVGPDPFGQLQGASLDVQCGPLIRGSLIVPLLNDFDRPFDNSYKIHLEDGKTFLLRGEGQIHADLEIEYQSVAEYLYFLPILIDANAECLHYRTGGPCTDWWSPGPILIALEFSSVLGFGRLSLTWGATQN